ncbi:MAG: hypothetical protein WCG27_01220 [Pseudomonadota bacterium]
MNIRIQGFYPYKGEIKLVDIFGYTTRGIPGLEIVGLPTWSKLIREKFIYLTRTQNYKMPMKRYVLCVGEESIDRDLLVEQGSWLELPLLILFWSLSGLLPIHRLEECYCSGKVSISGRIQVYNLTQQSLNHLEHQLLLKLRCRPKLIGRRDQSNYFSLSVEELMGNLAGITFPVIPLQMAKILIR